ncbi:MAG: hypothetical protein IJC93_00935 [Clostridia bacterium]|nr:hypothetical protein [Clostridia bacterium]
MLTVVIFCLAVLVIGAAGICVLIAKRQGRHRFRCKHCGRSFQPAWKEMLFEVHALNAHRIRCPFCGIKDFCEGEGKN